MATTTHRSAGWRLALAAAGVTALATTGFASSASAEGPASPGSRLKVASNAQIAADPLAGQNNLGPRLNSGASLTGGSRLSSPSGQYNVSMFDAEGYGRIPLMYSRTCGWVHGPMMGTGHNGGQNTSLVMQSDGNLVNYQNGQPRWSSRTHGNPGAFFVVQNDGNMVVYSAAGRPLWASGYQCDFTYTVESRELWKGNGLDDPLSMRPGDVIHSPNGSKRLVLQRDGNLVVYRGTTPLWSTRTHNNPGAFLVSQFDGNFVLYSAAGKPLWNTGSRWVNGSSGNEGYQLMIQNDGNLVNYHWNNVDTTAVTVQWHAGSRG